MALPLFTVAKRPHVCLERSVFRCAVKATAAGAKAFRPFKDLFSAVFVYGSVCRAHGVPLLNAEQALNATHIGFVHVTGLCEVVLALSSFFCQDVVFSRFGTLNLTCSGNAKTLLRGLVGLFAVHCPD